VYNGPKYNGTSGSNGTNMMNNLGDGYFQIVNQNQTGGVFVLDNEGSLTPGSAVVQNSQEHFPLRFRRTPTSPARSGTL